MGKFWGGVWGLLATILAGFILHTFQDDIKRQWGGQPIVAEVYVGPWAAYPRDGRPDPETRGYGDINSPRRKARRIDDDFPFAMISVRNRSHKPVENVTFDMRTTWTYDILIVDRAPENPAEPRVLREKREFVIPKIEPNREYRVYLWSPVGLEHSFLWSEVRSFSNEGHFRLTVQAYEEVDGRLSDPWWLKLLENFGGFAMQAMMVIVIILLIWALFYYESYLKRLLKSDDFYIEERVRYEQNPDKFDISKHSK